MRIAINIVYDYVVNKHVVRQLFSFKGTIPTSGSLINGIAPSAENLQSITAYGLSFRPKTIIKAIEICRGESIWDITIKGRQNMNVFLQDNRIHAALAVNNHECDIKEACICILMQRRIQVRNSTVTEF